MIWISVDVICCCLLKLSIYIYITRCLYSMYMYTVAIGLTLGGYTYFGAFFLTVGIVRVSRERKCRVFPREGLGWETYLRI